MRLRKILNSTLIVGAVILLIGGLIFVIAFGTAGFNLNAFSYVSLSEKTFSETGTTTAIEVTAEKANVYFYAAKENQGLTVKYTVRKSREGNLLNDVTFTEQDGMLLVEETESSEGRLLILDIQDPQIEIYLPTDRTYDLSVNSEIGNVRISGTFSMNNVLFNTKTGMIYTEKSTLTGTAVALSAIGGNVNVGEITADEVSASVVNGSISINGNVTADTFSASSKNGQIYYRSSVIVASSVTLSATRGNVKAKLLGTAGDYLTTVTVEKGRSNVEETFSGTKHLLINVSDGNIHIDFEAE